MSWPLHHDDTLDEPELRFARVGPQRQAGGQPDSQPEGVWGGRGAISMAQGRLAAVDQDRLLGPWATKSDGGWACGEVSTGRDARSPRRLAATSERRCRRWVGVGSQLPGSRASSGGGSLATPAARASQSARARPRLRRRQPVTTAAADRAGCKRAGHTDWPDTDSGRTT